MIMKRIFSVTLFIIILCLNCFASYASNENCFEKESLDSSVNQEIVSDENEKDIKKSQYHGYYYRKKVTSTTTKWTSYKRVSNNVKVPPKGATITQSKQLTFGVTVSGSIYGLCLSTSASVSTENSYSLNGTPRKTQYLGFRVKYKVEKGVRYVYNQNTNKVVDKNNYTYKKPMYGEYALITVK